MSKILAIGDIHTKTWMIEQAQLVVDHYDHIIFCGDYADNWNTDPQYTMQTWRELKAFMDENPKVRAVVGNHDFAYIHPEIAGRSSGWNAATQALINAPENKSLKNWLLKLPPVISLDGVCYSHAGMTEQWNGLIDVWSLWEDSSPIWARPKEFGGRVTYIKVPQVIGHNPSETVWQPDKNVWCIDTFSEHQDNTPIGDYSVLEVINGEEFNIKKLTELNEYYNHTSSIETEIS